MLKINPRVASVCCLGRVLSRCFVISPPKVLDPTLSRPEAFAKQESAGISAARSGSHERLCFGQSGCQARGSVCWILPPCAVVSLRPEVPAAEKPTSWTEPWSRTVSAKTGFPCLKVRVPGDTSNLPRVSCKCFWSSEPSPGFRPPACLVSTRKSESSPRGASDPPAVPPAAPSQRQYHCARPRPRPESTSDASHSWGPCPAPAAADKRPVSPGEVTPQPCHPLSSESCPAALTESPPRGPGPSMGWSWGPVCPGHSIVPAHAQVRPAESFLCLAGAIQPPARLPAVFQACGLSPLHPRAPHALLAGLPLPLCPLAPCPLRTGQ